MTNNHDHAMNTRFRFNLTNYRGFSLRLQKVPAAPVTLGATNIPTPGLADINLPSNKFTFDPITLDFIVSEDYDEYFAILDWMQECRVTEDYEAVEERGELELLNSQYQPVGHIIYKDIWPSEVGELTYETDGEAVILKCTVTCFYSDIDWKKVNG